MERKGEEQSDEEDGSLVLVSMYRIPSPRTGGSITPSARLKASTLGHPFSATGSNRLLSSLRIVETQFPLRPDTAGSYHQV